MRYCVFSPLKDSELNWYGLFLPHPRLYPVTHTSPASSGGSHLTKIALVNSSIAPNLGFPGVVSSVNNCVKFNEQMNKQDNEWSAYISHIVSRGFTFMYMRIRSDNSIYLRQPLSIHSWSHLTHPTHEWMTAWHWGWLQPGFTTPSPPQWFFHILNGDGTAISTWSSKPCEGLTICSCHCKGSTFVLGYLSLDQTAHDSQW